MKARKNLMSALLGAALLAMPITAAAHPHDGGHNRAPAPAFHPAPAAPAYRQMVEPRANFAPRIVAYNRTWMAPASPIVPIHDHDDWRRWRDRDDDGWKHHRDRDDWRWRDHDRDDGWRYRRNYYGYRTLCDEDGDDCRQVPRYRNFYRENYQPDSYDYSPQYYGAPFGGGLASLIRERDNAQILYQQAVQNGNRVRAKHLRNDIVDLNNRIARARGGYAYSGYGAYNTPYANPYDNGYGNGYGYGNSNLDALIGPLLGNYIH